MYSQAIATRDPDEKAARFRKLIDEYGDSGDDGVRSQTIRAGLKLAESTAADSDKMKLYDDLIERNRGRHDKRLDSLMSDIFQRRIKLASTEREEERFIDEFLDWTKKSVSRISFFDGDKVLQRKAELSGDPDVAAIYYDTLIASGATDEIVSSAMARKALATADDSERSRIYDEMLTRFRDSDNLNVIGNLLTALDFKANLEEPADTLIPLYDEIVEKLEKNPTKRKLFYIGRALMEKASLIKDNQQKVEIYDKVIAFDGGENTVAVQNQIGRAVHAKSRILGDRSIIDFYYAEKMKTARTDKEKIAILNAQTGFDRDRQARIELLDQIIAFRDSTDESVRKNVAEAFARRADLADSKKEASEMLRAILDLLPDGGNAPKWAGLRIKLTYEGLARLADREEEKIQLHDQGLARLRKMGELKLASYMMLTKAWDLEDKTTKISVLDEIIKEFDKPENMSITDPANSALFSKAKLLDDREEKLALLNELIKKYEVSAGRFMNTYMLAEVLSEKAKALGDEAVITEYADAILAKKKNRPKRLMPQRCWPEN